MEKRNSIKKQQRRNGKREMNYEAMKSVEMFQAN